MPRAIVSSVEMSEQAVQAIRKLAEATGMKQKTLVGTVLEWFTSLPRLEQHVILHRLDMHAPDLGELLIRRKLAEVLDERTAYNAGLRAALGLAAEAASPGTGRSETPQKRRSKRR